MIRTTFRGTTTLVMSQSVKQSMTVNLFPHILATVVDIQKEHHLLHTPVLNKTPRSSSFRMSVRRYRLLLIHCIYVSVTKTDVDIFSKKTQLYWYSSSMDSDNPTLGHKIFAIKSIGVWVILVKLDQQIDFSK